ncbi:C6 transcription factor [Coccidioides immitis RS]|uniref:C6 transcription factor n=2 Tax=Coccidioides immitis TaxID=5501 RepID=J3K9G6_COCIM|nr:C6 transcription factor [Coccidioides immitis RS]EAS31540.3 C6 transcription factor [Coccidioides immitis RS]KMP04184.1 Zn(II)2Cys6 cluster transcripitional activator [Coccidioides immitis RMSCC 2394]
MASVYPDLDTPLLKVSRPVAACSRCRNAKIKCDGKLPACSACEKAGRGSSCSGATDKFAKGKERSYVASLEAQCERLEKKIEATKRRQQGIVVAQADRENVGVHATPTATTSSSNSGDATYGQECSDIDDLVGDFGFLAVNATSRDFYGICSSTSFAGLLLTVAVAQPLPRPIPRIGLPPHSQVASLTLSYFDNFYPLMPFLSETNFWASVDAIYQDNGRFANSHDHWTLRMVLAISAASKSRLMNDRDSQIAMSYVHVALGHSEDVLKPGTIAGIQAILLLAQYSMLNPGHFRTWYLIGIAARVATDLGIHQEHASAAYLDKAVLDSRRRTFHCVYSLDRTVSTALGRAFSFSDDSINVPFPPDPPLSAPTPPWHSGLFLRSIEPALCLFQIRHFQSAAYQDMFLSGHQHSPTAQSCAWERCSAAATWFQNCPKDAPAHFSTLFHLEYLYTLILVLSPSNRSPTISETNQILLFEYSIDFISQLYNEVTTPTAFAPLLTYIDIERTYYVVCKLFNLLRQNHHELLRDKDAEQRKLQRSRPIGGALPAPLRTTATCRQDSTKRALTCLYEAHSIFEYAFRRWNVRSLLDGFNHSSIELRVMLSSMLEQQQQQQQYTQPAHGAVKQSRLPRY